MRIKQVPNYELIIQTNSYTGNFERKLVGYALGILDNEQMNLDYTEHERALFWKEEFQSKPIDFCDDYELKDEYLMETYQSVDDWEQFTFYHIAGNDTNCDSLALQLVKPLNEYWEEIIIRRIKKFFEVRPTKYDWILPEDGKLVDLFLIDSKGNRIKEYLK